jgi:hypothetical protein
MEIRMIYVALKNKRNPESTPTVTLRRREGSSTTISDKL